MPESIKPVVRKTPLMSDIEDSYGGTDIETLMLNRMYRRKRSLVEIAVEWDISVGTAQKWATRFGITRKASAEKYWLEKLGGEVSLVETA